MARTGNQLTAQYGTITNYITTGIVNKLNSVTDGASGGDNISMTPVLAISNAANTAQSIIDAIPGYVNSIATNFTMGIIPADSLEDSVLKQTGDNILPNFNAHLEETVKYPYMQMVSVLDEGATKDGVTDDLLAFNQSATKAETNSCNVWVPSGTYYLSAYPTIPAGVRFIGYNVTILGVTTFGITA